MQKVLLSLAFVLLATGPALAGVGHVQWCEAHSEPAPEGPWLLAEGPDGSLRGIRSPAELVRRAKDEARRDPKAAIEWAKSCRWGNRAASDEIDRDREAVLDYLRK